MRALPFVVLLSCTPTTATTDDGMVIEPPSESGCTDCTDTTNPSGTGDTTTGDTGTPGEQLFLELADAAGCSFTFSATDCEGQAICTLEARNTSGDDAELDVSCDTVAGATGPVVNFSLDGRSTSSVSDRSVSGPSELDVGLESTCEALESFLVQCTATLQGAAGVEDLTFDVEGLYLP